MKLIITLFSLLILTILPFTISDGFAQCILTSPVVCLDSPILSLKEQLRDNTPISDIMCPDYGHVLAERSNGKLACVTDYMAQKMGWYNISDIDNKSTTKWRLDGYTIPIKLDNVVLEYIRAEYHKQKIYMHTTILDDTQFGKIEFKFPKQTVSEIFDKENCFIFDRYVDVPKFNLKVNQDFKGTFDVHYLAADKIDNVIAMGVDIEIPKDARVVELFSTCNSRVPFLDQILTVPGTDDSIKYTTNGQTKIINGTVDEEYELLLITMNPSSVGELVIELPRDVIDAKHDYCPPKLEFPEDDTFFVLENGAEINFEEIFTTVEKRILRIPFNENTSKIEIIGPCLI